MRELLLLKVLGLLILKHLYTDFVFRNVSMSSDTPITRIMSIRL